LSAELESGRAALLEIVETAVRIIDASAGALLLIDEEADELVFEVAIGGKAEEVKRFRVALGQGVAGLVALSGQPMSIADASEAETARDIAEAVGYYPRNLICVPLVYESQVIGVLEVLDKRGAEAFGPDDMKTLSLFAGEAAIAIARDSR